MRLLYVLLILSLASGTAFSEHPIYVSTAEIDYNAKAKRLEIALQIFSDDLGEVLTQIEGESIEIGTDREHAQATELIKKYLKGRFDFTLNGKQRDFRYLGRKSENDDIYSLWVLLEVPNVRRIKSLTLHNSVLMDLHEEQKNYVKFRTSREELYARKVAIRGEELLVLK